eukprot:TRINITY_DN40493_c0_g1_i1.p1 TRINITY_DN40493_c0_g1~~TRINITY_DN40493_c0_g1_i1.p1  ORF type:complete len:187 (+),score=6.69 TRINITY_DN40493_c0_g1_i1:115-675(+)
MGSCPVSPQEALASTPVPSVSTSVPKDRFCYLELPGYCEPNGFSETLCSASSQVVALPRTCDAMYAGRRPVVGDWTQESGFAYFDPSSCDESCARRRCDEDPQCVGYTLSSLGGFDGKMAVSLKNTIERSTPWKGYSCLRKATPDAATECAPLSSAMRRFPCFRLSALLLALITFNLIPIQGSESK